MVFWRQTGGFVAGPEAVLSHALPNGNLATQIRSHLIFPIFAVCPGDWSRLRPGRVG
jgi:hypothetical protein